MTINRLLKEAICLKILFIIRKLLIFLFFWEDVVEVNSENFTLLTGKIYHEFLVRFLVKSEDFRQLSQILAKDRKPHHYIMVRFSSLIHVQSHKAPVFPPAAYPGASP